MAAFKFSLEQVLTYRAQLEDEASVRYARCQTEWLGAQAVLEKLYAQAKAHEAERKAAEVQEASTLWLHEQYARGLREDIKRQQNLEQQLKKIVEEARLQLAHCAKERKILEKLKEKQAQRHAQEERYSEQKSYDETAQIRYKPQAF